MEEKQKKQIEIIREVLYDEGNHSARVALQSAHVELTNCAKMLVQDLSVIDALRGHSHAVMAASAILGIGQQIEMLLYGEK